MPRSAVRRSLHYAVTTLDRYGNESEPTYEDGEQSAHHSSLLPNDGRLLFLDFVAVEPSEYLMMCTLQGAIVHTCSFGEQVDISALDEGIYQLKTLSRKGVAHRVGFFIIKR